MTLHYYIKAELTLVIAAPTATEEEAREIGHPLLEVKR
jgi:hypothetical protein